MSSDGFQKLEKEFRSRHKFYANRWFRLITFGVAVTFTSCVYCGWQQYSLMLMKGGKYFWLCDPFSDYNENDGFVSCAEQEDAVGQLFALASSLESFGALFAGLALDRLGPKISGILGSIIGLIAIVLMVESRADFNVLPFSMALTGLSINLVAFPALILEDWFPSAAATVAAFVIACQGLACLIAPVIWEWWKLMPNVTFRDVWYFYLVVIWIPISIFYALCLPSVREGKAGKEKEKVDEQKSSQELVRAVFSPRFVVLNIVNMVLMVQTSYYQIIVRPFAGQAISDFIGWSLPTTAIWGLLLGLLVDLIKTPSMCILIFCGVSDTL
eukprot:Blabericola_migrator_1__326@NODE_1083_length_5494_cov_146_902340_g742_i0_p2_GENE_NODE_1083_length_5494_cov_146_902340_g742_i0NODE_1083_length_5494_cov_146_902340_g742_i0_p2_ORF_typecomplete_len328_score34_37MFS_1/PF07690_16/3_2e02MFS_1/PF07690_16/1_1e11Nodulinlike/PF06813_13/3_2e08Sugar_tr/PF00083_24/1_8e05MFS_4/PF06779_14/0_005MFS_5/PF05631_14/0_033MFS_5/PF05631_14/2e03PUCC/PF03209_15/1_4e02PUCC/PF03209_15/0_14WBP1/PF11669_8/74WBP1/PF11669_8/9_6DHHC/PF01529_20/1_7e03DHHC/PF01529_20/0_45_NODE_10